MTIYNALKPKKPLTVDTSKLREDKIGKAATFQFLQACMSELKFPPSDCFLITDLYAGDTGGFVKVRAWRTSHATLIRPFIATDLKSFCGYRLKQQDAYQSIGHKAH